MHAEVKNFTSTLPRSICRTKGDCGTTSAEYAIGLERDDMIRPTYGAYACNTLPRGPYLQYKFNDQQIDNNTRQRQHIDELRREFLNLPRAKLTIHKDDGHALRTQTLERYTKREIPRDGQNLIIKERNSQQNLPTLNYQTLPKAFATTTGRYLNRVEMANVHQIHTLQQKSDLNQLQAATDYENSNFPFPLHHHVTNASNVLKCQQEEIHRAKISGSTGCTSGITSVNQLNYVTLDDVLTVRPNGFTASEGWALLCQTVQALQDLFLADTPSTSRILPLVTPTSLQITSRGRVAFNIIPAGQTIAHELGRITCDAVNYLAPEFLAVMSKKITFSESDIEKMWIYSLGVTLFKTLPMSSPASVPTAGATAGEGDEEQAALYQEPLQYQGSLAPLDFVIRSMCNKNLHNRSTLMYLLDVISEYCKVHHQVKPFSHTVMELFQQVIDQKEHSIPSRHMEEIKSQEEQKSDTDSGRSSDHGEIFRDGLGEKVRKLEVKRIPVVQNAENAGKSSGAVIGQKQPKSNNEEFNSATLQVIRRKRKREALRRNTIDVNRLELQNVREHMMNASKSTTCLLGNNETFNRKFDEIDFSSCGISLPNLHVDGKTALPSLKVRRAVLRPDGKEDIGGKAAGYSEKGPDFIVKSFVTPKQIDISDAKCQNRRSINVLLLNGHIIQILCNPVTTTTQDVFQAVMESEDCGENFFLGICALIGGDFVFLPLDLKIYKVAPQAWINVSKKENLMENITFTLFIRIKFYLPTLRGISSLESRHILYLQLRKSILERHILCTDDDLITLGGFALQAEVGDFKENMKYMEYFTLSHYLPEGVYQKNREMAQYLRNSHYRKRGLLPLEAEHSFIRYVQELKEYGLHLYSAIWVVDEQTSINVYVAISLRGICLFHRNLSPNFGNHLEIYAENSKILYQRKLYAKFEWLEIENLCYSKHILCIVVRNSESLKAKDTNRIKYKLRMDGRKSYFAFSLASDHHKFYMTLRNSFASLKMISSELNVPLRGKLSHSIDDEQNIPDFVPKIEKPTKPQGNRMRNLKKSMLNDNKLIKLRQKFLKRSKSSVEMSSVVENIRRSHITREEVQNKENECPSSVPVSSTNSSPRSATWGRNKVKMGTRVFSSQFLNKSFDNICDNVVNSARSEGNYSLFEQNFAPISENLMERDYSDGDNSLKSTSLGSILYAIDKRPVSPPASCDAYVIHSSIRSVQNNYSLPNESISDTLMDKFNNISCSTAANDRVIAKIKIVKDKVAECKSSSFERVKFSTLNPSRISKKLMRVKNKLLSRSQESVAVDERKSSGYTLGISIVQGSDNNMYVKDLVPDGPGARNGIRIGDQILAVDGISLLSLPYTEALKLLQTSSNTVDLVVSQLLHQPQEPQVSLNFPEDSIALKEPIERRPNNNFDYLRELKSPDDTSSIKLHKDAKEENSMSTKKGVFSKSVPDLPKIVAIFPKEPKAKMSIQRKFFGHHKFPVTPAKELKRTTIAPVNRPQPLSLPTEYLLPPLKVPKIGGRLNRETFTNMRKRANCKRISETIQSTVATLHAFADRHEYPNSRISTISSLKLDLATPKSNPQSENYGLYALKCDRGKATQRGIILHIPTKGGGSSKKARDPKAMIHEKFEPCQQALEAHDGVQCDAGGVKKVVVVAPPRRKRRAKRSQKAKLPQLQFMTSNGSIDTEERDIEVNPVRVVAECTVPQIKLNLMENRVKIARRQKDGGVVDIFKINHSHVFEEFDAIFDSVPGKDEKFTSDDKSCAQINAIDDTKVKLNEDVRHKRKSVECAKIKGQLEKTKVSQGYPVPNATIEQRQISNYVPECKITRSISDEKPSRLERIQFHNEFIPNSLSLKLTPIPDTSLTSEASNSIDYYIIKSSERKAPLTLAPSRALGEGTSLKYYDDENAQIWTI